MNSERVDVILATYNGMCYLEELLDSILNQTHKNITIFVSDDGSTDGTWDIVLNYSARDPRVIPISNVRQGGVINNFNNALRNSTSQYIMFADQDDVWLDDKVQSMLSAIKLEELSVGNLKPALVFSDLTVVDSKLGVIGSSFYRSNKLDPSNNKKLRYILWRSTVYGCTVIFNRRLFVKSGLVPDCSPMHDQWFALQAILHGKIAYLEQQTILYRQHENNVVGSHNKNFISKLLNAKKNILSIKKMTKKCIAQFNKLNREGDVDKILNSSYGSLSFTKRVLFAYDNIFPFFMERKVYAAIFIFYFLFTTNDSEE